jgi:hypothetical protein
MLKTQTSSKRMRADDTGRQNQHAHDACLVLNQGSLHQMQWRSVAVAANCLPVKACYMAGIHSAHRSAAKLTGNR